MAIAFLEQRKRLKSLVPILAGVLLIVAIIIWRGFFTKLSSTITPETSLRPFQEVNINFQVLENPILEELQLFEKTSPFKGEVGRENPFISY
jgi:hypothetical protein